MCFHIGPVTGPRSAILPITMWLQANMTDLGPVTGSRVQHMIDMINTIIYIYIYFFLTGPRGQHMIDMINNIIILYIYMYFFLD